MKKTIFLILLIPAIGFMGCTDLEEEIRDSITAEDFANLQDVESLLEGAYLGMQVPFQNQDQYFCSQAHTSDECIGPTRGGDWDDNGVWRVLHNHTWQPDHAWLQNAFDGILQVVFRTTNLLQFVPEDASPDVLQIAAEARFLRAYAVYCIADGWGQVPYRDAGENLLEPARVLTGQEAIDLVISELEDPDVRNNLPDGPANVANKDAATVLLMKAYLNRGVYADRQNPTFNTADMNRVIELADELVRPYELAVGIEYYDNFAPNNDQISKENIWTAFNNGGVQSGLVRAHWFQTLHYNQNPSGWNGFTTLGDFYDSFEDDDVRKGAEYPPMTDVGGVRAGFLFGQQFDQNGNELNDRQGNKLAFTKEVKLVESGSDLEITGIRVVKYPVDYENGDNADNDFVYFRYPDVILMKAEALLRNGMAGSALSEVNELRAARGASPLASLDLDEMLAERGREFYFENQRRTDLIRFGKFLEPWQEKPASGPERLLFPIPANAIAVNPNLKQNPGY